VVVALRRQGLAGQELQVKVTLVETVLPRQQVIVVQAAVVVLVQQVQRVLIRLLVVDPVVTDLNTALAERPLTTQAAVAVVSLALTE